VTEFLKEVERVRIGAAFDNVVQQRKQLLGAFAAEYALAAGFRCVNSMKNRAMLTMQVFWFITTSPPEPTIAPTDRSES
jgi:hypothetical protein